jgi:alkylation response protein AidB-like acyl-CoA dehydrogenase
VIELQELRDSAQKAFPTDKLTPQRDQSWQLAAEMGWLMIELAEDRGGLELGRGAAAAVHYELGRVLPAMPLAPALLALIGIAESKELANSDDWIERICGGEYVPLNMLPGSAKIGNGGTLSGTVSGVFDADIANHVLTATAGRYDLIPLDAEGVTVVEREVWDPSRRLFDVLLDGYAPSSRLVVASGNDAAALHDRISPSAQLAIAADSLGGANAMFEMTVEYLKTRKQFGRPLALFQALKHRMADLQVKLEAAEALFWSRANDESTMAELGALKAHCNVVYRDVVEEAIQLHGGIGLTEEYPCHLFFKRAMLNAELAGGTMYWEAQSGQRVLATS